MNELNKFTYLNTFSIELTHRCSDNGGSTVRILGYIQLYEKIYTKKFSPSSICMA